MTYSKQRRIAKVPEFLVKEMLNGLPIYYKGYKSVLKNEKKIEDIMGASGLQVFIVRYFIRLLDRMLNEHLYYVLSGEGGIHIDKNNNVSGDVLIFDKKNLNPAMIDTHYLNIPPLINIEIDVQIDNGNFTDWEYIETKTKNLLAFGVQKVVWILTKTKQVIVSEPEKDWLIIDWTKDVEIMDGVFFNVPKYLESEGVKL